MIKRFLVPCSLRYQLLTRSLYILSALLLLIGVLQYWLMKDFVYHNKAETMMSQMAAVPREIMERIDRRYQLPSSYGTPLLFMPDSSLALIDLQGNFYDVSIDDDNSFVQLPRNEYGRILQNWSSGRQVGYRIVENFIGGEQLVVFRPLHTLGRNPRTIGIIQMSAGTDDLKQLLIRQLIIFVLLSLFSLVTAITVSLSVIRRTLIPLSRIVRAVEQTNAGTLSERLSPHQGQEEIDRLSIAFNSMLQRLDDAFRTEKEAKEQMRQFIADASHELRTPLTSIHGFLEVLLRGAAQHPDQLENALRSMQGESKRLNKLVEDLLLLAKLDRTPQLQLGSIQLDELLLDMESQLQILAGKRKIHIEIQEPVQGIWDADKIKQVILNLTNNAIEHTDPEHGEILLSLGIADRAADRTAILAVKDNGVGISEQHLPHIFDRFYRVETSRSRRTGGSGLGLAITRSIAEAHGGSIQITSKLGEGSTFMIRLPLDVKIIGKRAGF